VENPDWKESLFDVQYPWYCDELMPSAEDVQIGGKVMETVNCYFLYRNNNCNNNNNNFILICVLYISHSFKLFQNWPVCNW